jgi:hypothetical protein
MKNSLNGVRSLSIAALVAVPVFAVAFLGLGGFDLPAWQMNETRTFNLNGQNIAVPAAIEADQPVDLFLNNWQNTVRIPPSPRV